MVFNTTVNNFSVISWLSDFLVEDILVLKMLYMHDIQYIKVCMDTKEMNPQFCKITRNNTLRRLLIHHFNCSAKMTETLVSFTKLKINMTYFETLLGKKWTNILGPFMIQQIWSSYFFFMASFLISFYKYL